MSKLTTLFFSMPHFLGVKQLLVFKYPFENLAFTLKAFKVMY